MNTRNNGSEKEDSEPADFERSPAAEVQAAPVEAAPPKRRKPPSPRNCRSFIRQQTASAMPDIVQSFVDKAKEGSVPHFTSLAKVGGFDQRSGSADAPKRRRISLAQQLLEEVEQYEAKLAAELAAADQATSPIDNSRPQEKS